MQDVPSFQRQKAYQALEPIRTRSKAQFLYYCLCILGNFLILSEPQFPPL